MQTASVSGQDQAAGRRPRPNFAALFTVLLLIEFFEAGVDGDSVVVLVGLPLCPDAPRRGLPRLPDSSLRDDPWRAPLGRLPDGEFFAVAACLFPRPRRRERFPSLRPLPEARSLLGRRFDEPFDEPLDRVVAPDLLARSVAIRSE